jgi:hypothetical protein
MIIKITHQEDKSVHEFEVIDDNNLTKKEVSSICNSMTVKAIFVNGTYYEKK